MSKREFIRKHRDRLDKYIRGKLNNPDYKLNDREREGWVMNDERLCLWARREGVKV